MTVLRHHLRQEAGACTDSSTTSSRFSPSAIWATNFAQPYVHHVTDTWTTTAKVPLRLLGVPEDLAVPALEHVGRSPLAPLFSHHMAHVRQVADDINDAAAASLGTATLALARALVHQRVRRRRAGT